MYEPGRLHREYGATAETLARDVRALKEWAARQPHLPDLSTRLDLDKWLEGMLLLVKNSVERAKTSIDAYFTARSSCPSLFCQRNLTNQELKESFNHVKVVLLPGLTTEGHRAMLMKIDCADAGLYSLEAHMKRCTMIADHCLQRGVDFTGLHIVHDLQLVSLGHMTRFSLNLMRDMAIGMKAYPCRVPKITVINTPYFVDKVLALFKTFMQPKLMARVGCFKDSSPLLDILPSRMVPKDYGGDAPTLDELNAFWRNKLEESADFFALCDSLKTDESKRIGKAKFTATEFGQNGSFRQLSVD